MISRCSRQHSRAFPLLGQSRPTRESRTFAWIKGMTTTRFGNWGRYLAILCIFERERKKHKPSNGKSAGSARRWVVERTHSWMNRFRGVLIRLSRKRSKTIWPCSILLAPGLLTVLRAYWDRLLVASICSSIHNLTFHISTLHQTGTSSERSQYGCANIRGYPLSSCSSRASSRASRVSPSSQNRNSSEATSSAHHQ